MVANKKTKRNIIILCNDITNLLSDLNIEDKNNRKKADKIIKKSNECKDLIDVHKNKTYKLSGYNKYIKDCFDIKKGDKSSGLLNENEILKIIENNPEKNSITIFGGIWQTLDKDVKNKYNIDKLEEKKKTSNRGRTHKEKKDNKIKINE